MGSRRVQSKRETEDTYISFVVFVNLFIFSNVSYVFAALVN